MSVHTYRRGVMHKGVSCCTPHTMVGASLKECSEWIFGWKHKQKTGGDGSIPVILVTQKNLNLHCKAPATMGLKFPGKQSNLNKASAEIAICW